MVRHSAAVVAAALILSGCGASNADTDDSAGVTVRDSAGIRIVENHDSAWTEATRWRLADEPDLVLGSVDGSDPGTDWSGYPSAYSVGDRIAVLDPQTTSVRVFDRTGRFVAGHDLRGEGPGEVPAFFTNGPVDARRVAVTDFTRRRVVLLDVFSGERASYSISFPDSVPGSARAYAWTGDGSTIALASVRPDDTGEAGVYVQENSFHRFGPSGGHAGEVARVPMFLIFWLDPGVGWPTPTSLVEWAGSGELVVRGDAMWHGFPPEGFQLRRIDTRGEKSDLLVRIPDLPREPIPETFVERNREERIREVRPLPRSSASVRLMETMVYADSVPQYDGLTLSPDGTLWVRRMDLERLIAREEREEDPRPRSHLVVAPDGRWLGSLQIPPGTELLDVAPDHILTVRRDDLGVAFIELWRIIKPG